MTEHKSTLLLIWLPILMICTTIQCDRDDVRMLEQAFKNYLERPSVRGAQEVVEAFDTLKIKPDNQHYASTSFAKASWKGHPIDFMREIGEVKKERDHLKTLLQDEQDKNSAECNNLKIKIEKLTTELQNEHEVSRGLQQRHEALSQKVCIALDEKKFARLSYATQEQYSKLANKATPAYLEKVTKETLYAELAPALQMLAQNETLITDVACSFEPVNKLNRQTTRLEKLVRRIEKQHAKIQGHTRRTKELTKELEQERETRRMLEEKVEKQREEREEKETQAKIEKKAQTEKAARIEPTDENEEKSELENPLHQTPEQTPSVETDTDTCQE